MRSLVVLAALLSALLQNAPKPDAPPDGPGGRRDANEWKASLSLPTDLWVDATAATIGATGEWTNKVEIADLDADGRPDLLFANGGDYESPGELVPSRVFLNRGAGAKFEEITQRVFGEAKFYARVIKVRDVNRDGHADVFVGTTFGTQSALFLGQGEGRFRNATEEALPKLPGNTGDAEFGDADGDGDLDLVLAEWGDGSAMKNDGGRTRLWLNDGQGRFVDATAERMPSVLVRFSWELEWVDVDDDLDLDLLVSSKRSSGSFLFENDGTGRFTDVSAARLPQFTNNYEFEALDVDGDARMDLVTINDGARFSEHLLLADGKGGFVDATERCWPKADNPSFDDNMICFLDFDSDGDADFLIGSLDGPDRVLVNDGSGRFAAAAPVFEGDPTRGTLGIALADLDGDRRLDVVHAQGENPKAIAEKVFLAKSLAPDTAGPTVGAPRALGSVAAGKPLTLAARVHDRKTPLAAHDFRKVALIFEQGGEEQELPLAWYGECLWRATVASPAAGVARARVVAVDAAGNETVGAALELRVE